VGGWAEPSRHKRVTERERERPYEKSVVDVFTVKE
jgi:hypothetical protein